MSAKKKGAKKKSKYDEVFKVDMSFEEAMKIIAKGKAPEIKTKRGNKRAS